MREGIKFFNQGQALFGILHKPVERPFPLVLCCHGFGGNKSGKNRLWVMFAEELLRQGVGTFRFDFRGCGDSEGLFSQMTIESCVSDALVALQCMEEHPEVDNSALGIAGTSLGAAIAVLTACQAQKFQSMSLWAAVANALQWKSQWEHFAKIQDAYEADPFLEGEEKGACREFFQQFLHMRPDKSLQDLKKVPLLHIHGEKDEVVNLSHAEFYQKYRQEALAETKFMTLASADHSFTDSLSRSILLQETAEWFKNSLQKSEKSHSSEKRTRCDESRENTWTRY